MNQNPSLADVRRRRGEIAKQLQEMDRLKAEDRQLETVEDILTRLFSPDGEVEADVDISFEIDQTERQEAPEGGTIEEVVKFLLRTSHNPWWTSNDLQSQGEIIRKRPVNMNTLSPCLWQMKKDGVIVRDGLKVALASRVQTKEAPHVGGAPNGSSPEEGQADRLA